MALDDLLGRLRRESEHQVTELVESARRDGERMVRDSTATADREEAARLDRLHADHRALLSRDAAGARRENMGSLLTARRSAIAKVFARVRELVPGAIGSDGYLASIGGDLDYALSVLGDRSAVLAAEPAAAGLARARASGPLEIVTDPAVHGFRLQSADGRLEIDGTIEERLRRMAPGLAIEVVRAMEDSR